MKLINRNIIILFTALYASSAYSQTGTEFWFAAPEVSTGHGDQPIYFRITSFNQASVITVTQPANASFVPIIQSVAANSTLGVNLTPYLAIIENTPPNTVLNRGLRIQSTNPVTAYFEESSYYNPEIYSLKGINSLGTDFYIPSQNTFHNSPVYNPLPISSFDIVATENNTLVSITPSHNIVGHPAGVTFSVYLNQGQTYSATATSQSELQHLWGSHVTSNKPIAITYKDDSVSAPSGMCSDLIGDQIVPTDVIGTEYIVVKGPLGVDDRVTIIGTMAGTQIFLYGNATPVTTINTGGIYSFSNITGNSVLINASHPVYVLHISGFGCEYGAAIIPAIGCTGSEQVALTRITNEYFGVILITENGAQGNFLVNGIPNVITASQFSVVTGTLGQYVTANINLSGSVTAGSSIIISNSIDLFHVGLINGGAYTGCSYGFFSDFNVLNLGSDISEICPDDTVIINPGVENASSYLWQDGTADSVYLATESGIYFVTVTQGPCELHDSVSVSFDQPNMPDLGNDTTICNGASVTLSPGTFSNCTFKWSTIQITPSIVVTPSDTTTYYVTVTSDHGCHSYDSVTVNTYDINSLFTISDVSCFAQSATVTYTGNADPAGNYLWDFDGATVVSGNGPGPYQVFWNNPGTYNVQLNIVQGSCIIDATTTEVNNPSQLSLSIDPFDNICHGGNNGAAVLSVGNYSPPFGYIWSSGQASQDIGSLTAGNYVVTVSYNSICTQTASVYIDEPATSILTQLNVVEIECNGGNNASVDLSVSGGITPYTYQWNYNNLTTQDISTLSSGFYEVTISDGVGCTEVTNTMIEDPLPVTLVTSVDIAICIGQEAELTADAAGGTPGYSYVWSNYMNGPTINVIPDSSTIYYVSVYDSNGCTGGQGSVTVTLFPVVTAYPYTMTDSICPGDSTVIFANFAGGMGEPYYCILANGDSVVIPFTVSPDVTTTYIVSGADNCHSPSIPASITIWVMDIPDNNFVASPTVGCTPLKVQFFDTNVEPGHSYLWDFGDNGDYGYSESPSPVHTFKNPGIYDIALTTTSWFGCKFVLWFNDMITVYPKPDASFIPFPQTVSIIKPVIIFRNFSEDGISFDWDFGDGSGNQYFEPQHIYQDTGKYTVTLIVENSLGCYDTTINWIYIEDEFTVYAPNAINPDSRYGENTIFRPVCSSIVEDGYHLIVFDRWGEVVFETFNINHGWDGRIKNNGSGKAGSYPWLLICYDINGRKHQQAGVVTIIK